MGGTAPQLASADAPAARRCGRTAGRAEDRPDGAVRRAEPRRRRHALRGAREATIAAASRRRSRRGSPTRRRQRRPSARADNYRLAAAGARPRPPLCSPADARRRPLDGARSGIAARLRRARSPRRPPSPSSCRTRRRAAGISARNPAPRRSARPAHREARGGCARRPSPASRRHVGEVEHAEDDRLARQLRRAPKCRASTAPSRSRSASAACRRAPAGTNSPPAARG